MNKVVVIVPYDREAFAGSRVKIPKNLSKTRNNYFHEKKRHCHENDSQVVAKQATKEETAC